MNISKLLILVTSVAFIASCATSMEAVNVNIKRGYKNEFSNYLGEGVGSLTELIPANETYDHWSSMFSIQFMEGAKNSPSEAMQLLTNIAKKVCGDKYSSSVIKEDKSSITFEWKVTNCKQKDYMKYISRGVAVDDCNLNFFTGVTWMGSKKFGSPTKCNKIVTQSEIVRLMKGNDGLHRVAYTEKTENISESERNKWLASLERAFVVKDGNKVIIESN